MAMLAVISPLPSEAVHLDEGLGRVLSRAIVAERDQPPFAVSAMDGYAVRCADTPGDLTVAGESAAGHGYDGDYRPGAAIRISTGAPMPAGADGIVIQENVSRKDEKVTVPAVMAGNNIRPRGGDFRAGTILLPAGCRLDGVDLSLAAASGMAQIEVVRCPRVAILSSGDELAMPGERPGPYQIFDSATYGIAALVRTWGGTPKRLAVEKDNVNDIAQAAQIGLEENDLLVVIGGASVGDHDHARPALRRLGLDLMFEKVAVRPGKPTWFGTMPHGLVLGLPGNPASALVCARLFLQPLLEAMLGRNPEQCLALGRARLSEALPANGPREHYLRARVDADEGGQLVVRAFPDQDSSLISVYARANALIRIPANAAAALPGATVDILRLDYS